MNSVLIALFAILLLWKGHLVAHYASAYKGQKESVTVILKFWP